MLRPKSQSLFIIHCLQYRDECGQCRDTPCCRVLRVAAHHAHGAREADRVPGGLVLLKYIQKLQSHVPRNNRKLEDLRGYVRRIHSTFLVFRNFVFCIVYFLFVQFFFLTMHENIRGLLLNYLYK